MGLTKTSNLLPYLLEDGKEHPFVIVCPGGGFRMVSIEKEGTPVARFLNGQGYHAFVLEYTTGEGGIYPRPLEDLEKAIRAILALGKERKLLPSYDLWGFSIGGWLASCFSATYPFEKEKLPRPKALVLAYPVITMGEKSHQWSKERLLGNEPSPRLTDLLSVEKHVGPGFPPTFFFRGDADEAVLRENCALLKEALEKEGVPYVFHSYPGVHHSVGLAEGTSAEGWAKEAADFAKRFN